MVDTGELYLLIQFDFEKNCIQYENIKDIIVEYDRIEEELKYSREIWEKGKYVGFRNLAGGRHNVGKFVRMLEKINKELKSVEGDIMMIFACVNKATFIFLQAMGKAVESTLLSMVREIVFGVGFALLLPLFFGLDGVLYSMPVSDILTAIISAVIIVKTYNHLNHA